MRFHVPNTELDEYKNEKKNDPDDIKVSDQGSEDDEMTAAKYFQNKINAKTNIGKLQDPIVTSIQDLPMLIPRGNYSLDFYSNFAKLHGKTHNYKIMYKDINKIFLL